MMERVDVLRGQPLRESLDQHALLLNTRWAENLTKFHNQISQVKSV